LFSTLNPNCQTSGRRHFRVEHSKITAVSHLVKPPSLGAGTTGFSVGDSNQSDRIAPVCQPHGARRHARTLWHSELSDQILRRTGSGAESRALPPGETPPPVHV
jgi:hypothetical protein